MGGREKEKEDISSERYLFTHKYNYIVKQSMSSKKEKTFKQSKSNNGNSIAAPNQRWQKANSASNVTRLRSETSPFGIKTLSKYLVNCTYSAKVGEGLYIKAELKTISKQNINQKRKLKKHDHFHILKLSLFPPSSKKNKTKKID